MWQRQYQHHQELRHGLKIRLLPGEVERDRWLNREEATNKKAGEFYTPRSVVRLMIEMLDPKEGETIWWNPGSKWQR